MKRERPPLLFEVVHAGNSVRLLPEDSTTFGALAKCRHGSVLQADNLRQPRSLPRHRFYWKALSEIVAATDCAPDAERLHLAIKIGCGYRSPVQLGDGTLVWVPDSTSFESMDDAEFGQFMEAANKWCAENLGISLSNIMEGHAA